jgi:hypothetical protein
MNQENKLLMININTFMKSEVATSVNETLDDRASVLRRCRDFSLYTASKPFLDPTQPLIQWVLEVFSPAARA